MHSIFKKWREIKNKDQKPAIMLCAGIGAITRDKICLFHIYCSTPATSSFKDFAPVVGTARFHCGGHGFDPWSRN